MKKLIQKQLGELLIDSKLITVQNLEEALKVQKEKGGLVGQILVSLGYTTEEAIAQAYSLDRLILYKKIILPALADEKCVIQDRGVSTSLCYQTLSGQLKLDYLSSLPGNAVALASAPNHLIIIDVSNYIWTYIGIGCMICNLRVIGLPYILRKRRFI